MSDTPSPQPLRDMATQDLIAMLQLVAGPVIVELGRRGEVSLRLDVDAIREGRSAEAMFIEITEFPLPN